MTWQVCNGKRTIPRNENMKSVMVNVMYQLDWPWGVQTLGQIFSGWYCEGVLNEVIAAMKLKDAYSLEEKLWPTEIAY